MHLTSPLRRLPFPKGPQRRFVNLGFQPGFQLQLPTLLLIATAVFLGLFMAHTQVAYGPIIDVGFRQSWLRNLASEVHRDYMIVSASLGAAYVFLVLGLCLGFAHYLFGPVIAFQRQIQRLRAGDYHARVQLRGRHPLAHFAEELNALAADLQSPGGPLPAPLSPQEATALSPSAGVVSPAPSAPVDAESAPAQLLEIDLEIDEPLAQDWTLEPIEAPLAEEEEPPSSGRAPWAGWYARGRSKNTTKPPLRAEN